jgi:hypothetical protein
MAYGTPRFDYGVQGAQLATSKALTDNAQQFGRFMGQERHRRSLSDMNRQFKQDFPRVGSSFNQRGLWNSGVRRQGQRNYAEGYGRAVERSRFDHAAEEANYSRDQTLRDAGHEQAMLALYEQMQRARAAGYDPYEALRGQV